MRCLHTTPRYEQKLCKNRRGWRVKAAKLSWLERDEAETLILAYQNRRQAARLEREAGAVGASKTSDDPITRNAPGFNIDAGLLSLVQNFMGATFALPTLG